MKMEVKKEVNKKKNIFILWVIKCYKVKMCVNFLFLIIVF